jgi:hypothetical protein
VCLVECGSNESGGNVIKSKSGNDKTTFNSDKFEYMYKKFNSKLGLVTFIIILCRPTLPQIF